jgi:hypothetical protein
MLISTLLVHAYVLFMAQIHQLISTFLFRACGDLYCFLDYFVCNPSYLLH